MAKAAVKQTRQRKAIPSADALSPEAYETLKAAADALTEFIGFEDALRSLTVKPLPVVKSRDAAWSRFYKKMKQSAVFKGKRKPVSAEMAALNEKKGEKLAAITKAIKANGENHPSVKAARDAFKSVMKEIKDLANAEKASKKSK
jgi:hypothetical protein